MSTGSPIFAAVRSGRCRGHLDSGSQALVLLVSRDLVAERGPLNVADETIPVAAQRAHRPAVPGPVRERTGHRGSGRRILNGARPRMAAHTSWASNSRVRCNHSVSIHLDAPSPVG